MTGHFGCWHAICTRNASWPRLNCTARMRAWNRRLVSPAMPKLHSPNSCDVNSKNDFSAHPRHRHLCRRDQTKTIDSSKLSTVCGGGTSLRTRASASVCNSLLFGHSTSYKCDTPRAKYKVLCISSSELSRIGALRRLLPRNSARFSGSRVSQFGP